MERYPLLALFSSSEKNALKNIFLALCDAKLEFEEGKEIQNNELEEKIISQGEIKEEKFIEFLKLPNNLNNFGKILYHSFKCLKYLKKQVNAFEQETNIQKYLNKYEKTDKLDFEQFLFAVSVYCMKLDEEVLTNEKRIHCIYYSLQDEQAENQKENKSKEDKTSDDLDELLGLNSKEDTVTILYSKIKEIVLGLAWISKAHQLSIIKLKDIVNKEEKEKHEEKNKENKKNINEDVNPELIEKLTNKWKENLDKDMPNEVLQTLSNIHDSNKNIKEEINNSQKKDFFDYNTIDKYDHDIVINPDEIKIDESFISSTLDFSLPKKIRSSSLEEKNNYMISWKDWSKWYFTRVPNIFRILSTFIYNRLFNTNHSNNKSIYLLSNGVKGNGIIANMDNLLKLNCDITWEHLFVFSWFVPNNCMESHINMDVLYQATKDGFSLSRYEQCVRYYPGSTALFIIGELSNVKDTTQVVTGAFIQPPWKFNNSYWGNNQCSIFELNPIFESCQGTKKNTNYINCNNKNGIGFGGKVGMHRLWINNFFQKGGYQYDILSDFLNTYTPSETSFTQNFDIIEVVVAGFGGKESLEAQKKAWEFEKNEAERRNNINLRNADGEFDRNFLKMAGIIDESAEDKGIERYREKTDDDDN
ncbi:hypothetical protein BCR36DRAFT_319323 [Piromyces finnis]|uniref:TLDc domain-containing protein n=1 Tax=Piromyces finnis TaxID=1754191 RepID=A0A1Y1VIE5_9FUNG|nr:hypothetical protein BCR36DRAFT_319323 [Piromyces finnis]|eukprot:ORX57174.1 hypothetical protein BCR36DRAFT_319323 [Piromyces finnis]